MAKIEAAYHRCRMFLAEPRRLAWTANRRFKYSGGGMTLRAEGILYSERVGYFALVQWLCYSVFKLKISHSEYTK